jgi:hypothetical protein
MSRMQRQRWTVRAARLAAVAALGLAGFVGGSLAAGGPALALLDRIQPGLWEIRERNNPGGTRQVCVNHGRKLVQLRHMGETCKSFVVEDTAAAVTVQYTCESTGYGRTRIRFENGALVQLETQGIANGLPFDFSAEVRRVGNCPG